MNIVATTTAAEGLPRRVFTVDDISRMMDAGIIHEDERFELVEGEIVMMASKGIAHELIKSAMNIAVVRALPDHLTLGIEVTLRLTDILMLEPDIAVFPKELLTRASTGFARLEPGEAHLVIEVAVTSLAYDRGLKARLYARHGVRELWVIDANDRTAWVHTGASGERWSSIIKRGPQDALTTAALPGFSMRLGEIGQ
jgi:Uma2 family endonuclease